MQDTFQIHLDPELIHQFELVVYETQPFSVNHRSTIKSLFSRKKSDDTFRTWNLVCAIKERIHSTVDYLNDLVLGKNRNSTCAFDFLNFLNHAAVLCDCINSLASLYGYSVEDADSLNSIFKNTGRDNKGSDKRYFEYLRSICSVHPVNTSHYQGTYHDGFFECAPFVVWNDSRIVHHPTDSEEEAGDLYALVYENNKSTDDLTNCRKIIPIKIAQIFEYVTEHYQLISGITDHLKAQVQNRIEFYKNTQIKQIKDFTSEAEYIHYLKETAESRGMNQTAEELDYAQMILSLPLSCDKNKPIFEKYQAALRFSLSFVHNQLQNMSFCGFGNTGINYEDPNDETTLFDALCYPSANSCYQYSYAMEKILSACSSDSLDDKILASAFQKGISSLMQKYFYIDHLAFCDEYEALLRATEYFECLKENSILNRNIPNAETYRLHILSEIEEQELRKPVKPIKSDWPPSGCVRVVLVDDDGRIIEDQDDVTRYME